MFLQFEIRGVSVYISQKKMRRYTSNDTGNFVNQLYHLKKCSTFHHRRAFDIICRSVLCITVDNLRKLELYKENVHK